MNRDHELEEMLRQLRPASAGLNAAELAFAAGRQSAKRKPVWPAVTGLLAVTQVATLALWIGSPTATEDVPGVGPPVVKTQPARPLAPSSYAALRGNFEADGSLPTPAPESILGSAPDRPMLTVRSDPTQIDIH